ncbi:MAG: OmpA family protein [Bacteroidia bacterium]
MFKGKFVLSIIAFVFSFSMLKAQDTLSVFFDYAKSSINDESELTLKGIHHIYHVVDIDSVWLIGFTDSRGSSSFNERLALKRATRVENYFKKSTHNAIPTRVFAIGEISAKSNENARRVDVIIFFQEPLDFTDSLKSTGESLCYYPADELLDRSLISYFGNGKNQKVKITTEKFNSGVGGFDPIYYYGMFNKEGIFQRKRLKFQYVKTGKLWWRKRRFVAYVPMKSFKLFGVFTVENEPCNKCSLSFKTESKIQRDSSLVLDPFINKYLQYRKLPWKGKKVEYRVPSEFIESQTVYFKSCDVTDTLNWEKKTGGANNEKLFSYTDVQAKNNYLPNISRYKTRCFESNECKPYTFIQCGGPRVKTKTDWTIFSEFGTINNEVLSDYYLGLGLNLKGKLIENKLSLNHSFNEQPFFKYNLRLKFYRKHQKYVRPTFRWTSVTIGQGAQYYFNLFVGAQVLFLEKSNNWIYDPYMTMGVELYNLKNLKAFAQVGVFNSLIIPNQRETFFDYLNFGINYVLFK